MITQGKPLFISALFFLSSLPAFGVPTTTTLASSPNPSRFGQVVTLTATVPGATGGTVTFSSNGSSIGTASVDGSGVATFTISTLPASASPYSLTATFGGQGALEASTSTPIGHTVWQGATAINLSSSGGSTVFGQAVTFTADVSAVVPAAGTPTGSVNFYDGAGFTLIGTATLNGSGQASLTISTLAVGVHSIAAEYLGSSNFDTVTTSGFGHTVGQASTTTSVSSGVNPSVFGQSVTFTAAVAAVAPGSGTPTGTVAFKDGATTLSTVTLSGGSASYTTSALSLGAHTITAEYTGSTSFAASSGSTGQTVNQSATSTAVTSSTNPSAPGSAATFVATVSATAPGAGTRTGTVSFFDGATLLGSAALNGSGQASLSTTTLTIGSHTITAVYSGDTNFSASTSPGLTHVVSLASTSTALTSSANPSTFNQSVTFTATVTSSFAGTPTGTVTFKDGASTLGTAALNGSAQATFSTTALSAGAHSITAVYGGDATYTTSTSSALSQTVNPAATTTALSSSATPTVFGQSVTFTATVSSSAGTPTGTVTFKDGAATLGSGTVNGGGQATFSTSALAAGTHSITAVYSGDASFATSTSGAFSQTVNQAATSTALVSSANPSAFGQAVTFTASVVVTAPGAGAPTGTVTFKDGAATLGTGSLNGSGIAAFTTSSLPAGAHSVTATYNGDANFSASTAASVSQSVNKAGTSTAVVSSANPSVFGQSVILTATLTVTAPGAGTPTGTITFQEGSTTLGTAALASGQATLTLSSLSAGAHAVTASFSGDANFATSTSAALNQTVNTAATTTALTSSANPSAFNQAVTFTATVSAVAPGAGTPTGSVTFKDGAATLGTATLNASRQATFSLSTLSSGTHSITAVYGGDSGFGGSTSAALSQAVNKAATTTTLTTSNGAFTTLDYTTFTARVTSAAGTPTGTVTFRNGSYVLGVVPVDGSGVALLPRARFDAGNHSISAAYSGDGNFAASTSANVGVSVAKPATSISVPVLRTANPMAGDTLTIAATVTSEQALTGEVVFRDGPTTIGSAAMDPRGTAVVNVRLPIGSHMIIASYAGDDWNEGSASQPLYFRVRGAAAVKLTSSANPSASGAAVTFTATVSAPEASSPAPSGKVAFNDGAATLGTATIVNGQATFSATGLAAGEHSIVASYAGDENYTASSSTALSQRVTGVQTTTALDSGVDENGYYLTATVSASSGAPGGLVQFEDSATNAPLGSATLANGSATLRLSSPLPVGRRLRAVYAGDAAFAGSASTALPFIAAADAFSFTYTGFAQDSITSIFGADLAEATVAASSVPLPTTLGGVSVKVVDASGQSHTAGIYFVSPGQINIVMPSGVPPGPARLTVAGTRGSASLALLIRRSGPSLATADGSGSGPAAAHLLRVHADGSQDPLMVVWTEDIPFGAASDNLYLILYGTGFRNAPGPTTCSFNGQSATAMYAGPHATYPGLDQINVQAPGSLRGAGRVSVSCTAGGQSSNTVAIGLR